MELLSVQPLGSGDSPVTWSPGSWLEGAVVTTGPSNALFPNSLLRLVFCLLRRFSCWGHRYWIFGIKILDIGKFWFTFYDRKVPVRQKKWPKPLRAEKVQKGLQSGTAVDGQRGPPRAGGRRPSRLGPRCATPEPNTVPNTVRGRNEPEGSFKRRTHQPTARKKNLQLIASRRNPLSFTGLVLSDV